MLILGCGGRDYENREKVREVLLEYLPEDDETPQVVHGNARGADRIIGQEAYNIGYGVMAIPADWDAHGRRAGFIRNITMLDLEPDLVIAFPGGRGTAHTVREAEKRGIPVRRVA